jgi:hypothetical protein
MSASFMPAVMYVTTAVEVGVGVGLSDWSVPSQLGGDRGCFNVDNCFLLPFKNGQLATAVSSSLVLRANI